MLLHRGKDPPEGSSLIDDEDQVINEVFTVGKQIGTPRLKAPGDGDVSCAPSVNAPGRVLIMLTCGPFTVMQPPCSLTCRSAG